MLRRWWFNVLALRNSGVLMHTLEGTPEHQHSVDEFVAAFDRSGPLTRVVAAVQIRWWRTKGRP